MFIFRLAATRLAPLPSILFVMIRILELVRTGCPRGRDCFLLVVNPRVWPHELAWPDGQLSASYDPREMCIAHRAISKGA